MANVSESMSNDHVMLGFFHTFVRDHLMYTLQKREKEAERSMEEAQKHHTMKVLAYDLPRDPPDADPFYVLIYYHPLTPKRYMVTSANGNLLFTDRSASQYLLEQMKQDRQMLALGFSEQADGAAQFQFMRNMALTAGASDKGEPVSPLLMRSMCREAMDYVKQAGWLDVHETESTNRREYKNMTQQSQHHEVFIRNAPWGMDEFTVDPPNGIGWGDGDELAAELRDLAEQQGATVYELGKDALPDGIEDISSMVTGTVNRIFAADYGNGKVSYFGTVEKDITVEDEDDFSMEL